MPIYEFYCGDCHRIFSFLSRRIDTEGRPACPKCERPGLRRLPSSFAISKGRKEEPAGSPLPEMDESRLARVVLVHALGRPPTSCGACSRPQACRWATACSRP